MHYECKPGGWRSKQAFVTGKRKNLFINTYCSVSDHYFAALVTIRAVGALDRCQLAKIGGSGVECNSTPWNI